MLSIMDPTTIMIRFIVTFVLSLLFGLERQRSHKPIGFGTFIFVAVGSCALAVAATTLDPLNPLPLLGATITGIGFLGAGALIRTTDKVFGFTSAASIWVFAIFGLLMGLGFYLDGIVVYALIWLIIIFDRYFEKHGIGSYQMKLEFSTNKVISEKEIKQLLITSTRSFRLRSVSINKKENSMSFIFLIEGMRDELNKIPQKFFDKEWCSACRVE